MLEGHLSNFKVTWDKNRRFWPEQTLECFQIITSVWVHWWIWNELRMHKAWCSIEEVSYYFSRSSIKFQGHTGWKIDNFNPVWVRLLGRWQFWNPSDLPCSRSSDKIQGHTGQKIAGFDPNWAFPDCNSNLNSPMALKWCTKLDIV